MKKILIILFIVFSLDSFCQVPFFIIGNNNDSIVYTLDSSTIGGIKYEIVTVGTQTWMCENLRYMDNDTGMYWYDNDSTSYWEYGILYTDTGANRMSENISGWHIPDTNEFQTLRLILGIPRNCDYAINGGFLKEEGTTYWQSPNTGAIDTIHFSARPCGFYQLDIYNFSQINQYFYMKFKSTSVYYYFMRLHYNTASILNPCLGPSNAYDGMSIRLIKD